MGAQSESHNLLRRVDYSHWRNGGAIATAGFQEVGTGGNGMTVFV